LEIDGIGKELEANRTILDASLSSGVKTNGSRTLQDRDSDGSHAERNSKRVDLAVLSAFKHCWAKVVWFCSSCG
jgi:hypothetical protein